MTVYAYYRVSTDHQDYENQKSGVIRYCNYKDIVIEKEVLEENVSGKVDFKKRKLGKLVKDLKEGDLLIVSELSRLSRSMTDTFELVKILKSKGVNIYCVKENMEINDTALGLMVMSVFAFSAQIERERISERTKEALARKKAEGIHLGRPFGSTYRVLKFDEVSELANAGLNKTQIASLFNCDRNTVHRFCRENNIDVKCKTGRRI